MNTKIKWLREKIKMRNMQAIIISNPYNINNDINFNEVKIIPIEHQKNANKEEVQKKMLRDDWIKQIEDKKQRLKEEKQKQIHFLKRNNKEKTFN